MPAAPDPVRARRAQVARWTLIANRLGYLCYGVAMAVFVIGFGVGFNATVAAVVVAGLIAGSILLAPSIVLGYAVRAAEKDDRAHGL